MNSTHVFWTDLTDEEVMTVPIAGGEPVPLATRGVCDDPDSAVDESYVSGSTPARVCSSMAPS